MFVSRIIKQFPESLYTIDGASGEIPRNYIAVFLDSREARWAAGEGRGEAGVDRIPWWSANFGRSIQVFYTSEIYNANCLILAN